MKKFISGALAATVVAACLTLNVQAKTVNRTSSNGPVTTAVADTNKMAKKKMKMTKKKMKMDKMKMDKMKKDTSHKM